MVLNKVLNIIENRTNEYISKANKVADSNPMLCEELNIKALALFDIRNEIKKEDEKEKREMFPNTQVSIFTKLILRELDNYEKGNISAKTLGRKLYWIVEEINFLFRQE